MPLNFIEIRNITAYVVLCYYESATVAIQMSGIQISALIITGQYILFGIGLSLYQ